jgi:hypothetical protein
VRCCRRAAVVVVAAVAVVVVVARAPHLQIVGMAARVQEAQVAGSGTELSRSKQECSLIPGTF